MKGLLLTLVVLGALLVGADVVAGRVAEGVVAQQARASGGLQQQPEVDVRGFPFLPQALRGRYEEVRLRTRGDVAGEVEVEALEVSLRGVRLPLRAALSGDVTAVPVDGLRGAVLLSGAYLSSQAPEGVTVTPLQDRVRVRGTVRVLGRELTAAAVSTVTLDGDQVAVRAQEFETGAGGVDRALARALGDRFDFRVDLPELPYGLSLTDVRVTPAGLTLRAAGGPTVLQR